MQSHALAFLLVNHWSPWKHSSLSTHCWIRYAQIVIATGSTRGSKSKKERKECNGVMDRMRLLEQYLACRRSVSLGAIELHSQYFAAHVTSQSSCSLQSVVHHCWSTIAAEKRKSIVL
jgi:hypothetical protein